MAIIKTFRYTKYTATLKEKVLVSNEQVLECFTGEYTKDITIVSFSETNTPYLPEIKNQNFLSKEDADYNKRIMFPLILKENCFYSYECGYDYLSGGLTSKNLINENEDIEEFLNNERFVSEVNCDEYDYDLMSYLTRDDYINEYKAILEELKQEHCDTYFEIKRLKLKLIDIDKEYKEVLEKLNP